MTRNRHVWSGDNECKLCGLRRQFMRSGGRLGGMVFSYYRIPGVEIARISRDKAAPPCDAPGQFTNPRYEYTTREFPTEPARMTPAFEAELERLGWRRAWADVTMEGTFVVYRREREETP